MVLGTWRVPGQAVTGPRTGLGFRVTSRICGNWRKVMGQWGRGGKGQEVEQGAAGSICPWQEGTLEGVVLVPGCPGPLGQGSALSVPRYGVPVVSWRDLGYQEEFGAWILQVCLSWGGSLGTFGDSGGIWPNSLSALPALELLRAAVGNARYQDKVVIRMDVAASGFCHKGKYDLDFKSLPGSSAPQHQGAALPQLH